MVKVATTFLAVTRKTITESVVTARMKETTKAETSEPLSSGSSMSRNVRSDPAPRLAAASDSEGEICLSRPIPVWYPMGVSQKIMLRADMAAVRRGPGASG